MNACALQVSVPSVSVQVMLRLRWWMVRMLTVLCAHNVESLSSCRLFISKNVLLSFAADGRLFTFGAGSDGVLGPGSTVGRYPVAFFPTIV